MNKPYMISPESGFSVGLLIALLLWIIPGCAGSPARVSPEQAVSQVQAQAGQSNKLQEQLLMQMGQSTLKAYTDYKVGPEDLLEVTFFGNDDLGREVRVNGRGDISLPLVGQVRVAGLSPQEIESRLVEQYKEGRFIRQPQITVNVKEYRHQRVMVTGAVVNPGSYEVIGPRSLLEMLGKSGGLVDKPEMKAGNLVYVTRQQDAQALLQAARAGRDSSQPSGPATVAIDLRRLLSGADLKLNLPIQGGDSIYVPPAKMAFVMGAVKKTGQVAVKDNLTVMQAIAMTEGVDQTLGSNNVTILRFDDHGERQAIPVNMKRVASGQEPDPLLKDNDIIFVQESGIRRFFFDFKNTVGGMIGLGIGGAMAF